MSLDVSLIKPACSHCGRSEEYVYSANITHNLASMAEAAGIYNALWSPGENGFKYAKDITRSLLGGYLRLKVNPDKYRQYNAPNGWGKYEDLMNFVRNYLKACQQHRDALIEVSQ